jgi:hypothetical protein
LDPAGQAPVGPARIKSVIYKPAALNYPVTEDLQVTIRTRKYWFLLGAVVRTPGNDKDLPVATTS